LNFAETVISMQGKITYRGEIVGELFHNKDVTTIRLRDEYAYDRLHKRKPEDVLFIANIAIPYALFHDRYIKRAKIEFHDA